MYPKGVCPAETLSKRSMPSRDIIQKEYAQQRHYPKGVCPAETFAEQITL
jgi:hypothetical protein